MKNTEAVCTQGEVDGKIHAIVCKMMREREISVNPEVPEAESKASHETR